MKTLKNWTIGFAAMALTAAGAFAGDWHRCGDYTTGGGAKEVPANFQNVRRVQIQCLDGGVNIQTVWVRNGGQKKENRVARSLGKGDKYEIELGGQDVTGFRISDSGNGRYRVHVLVDGKRHEDRHRERHDDRDFRRHYDDDRYDRGWDRYDRDWDRYDRDWDRRPPPPPPPPRRERKEAPSWWPW